MCLGTCLFAVYLDELSYQLSSTRMECTVGNMVVNHLMFADDICVFTLSISGLQVRLLDICGDCAVEHEITIVTKQLVFFFAPKSVDNLLHQMFI